MLRSICPWTAAKCVIWLVACGLFLASEAMAAEGGGTEPAMALQERLLLVDINRQRLDQTVSVLEDPAGMLYLSLKDLQRWRLRIPDAGAQLDYQGEKYFPLSALAGASHAFDPRKLTLMIELRPEAFAPSSRDTAPARFAPPTRPGHGGFFNYDLVASDAPGSIQRAGQFEFGYFNGMGVGTSSMLAENLGGSARVTRLETTWTTDYPDKLQSLHLGDSVNRPGSWGRSLRFGGIQYGSNFATQPGFARFPLQSAAGQAVLPSTVDVFVNNALVSRQNVPPGPFSINNLPTVTGAGEVRLVVRDLFGREQLVTQPFYASQSLLREGLEDFSYEMGRVRENFGINSNDYGDWLGSATYRRGVSERVTGEVHAETLQDRSTVGGGADYLMPEVGTVSSYFAGSHSNSGMGAMAQFGIERQARPWSLGARTQWTTDGFTQIGLLPQQLSPIQLSSVTMSYSAGAAGSIGMAYVYQQNREQEDARIATLSYSVSLGRMGAFSVTGVRNLAGDLSTTIFAMLSIPLDSVTSLSLSPQWVQGGPGGNREDFTATLQRNVPMGEGYGYRLSARSGGAQEGTFTQQNNIGSYSAGVSQLMDVTTTRLEASGGVAVLGGDAFLSRRIDQSFAVARIADYPNVRILLDNQPAGRTDASGNALIPRLRAYDRNVISIDQRDVPLDSEIGTLSLETTPYFRSGNHVTFPIKRARGATLTIVLEDGTPLPIGSRVQMAGEDTVFMVGYEGQVYLPDLETSNRLRATWRGQTCEFDVFFAVSQDPLPDLGVYPCKGVKP